MTEQIAKCTEQTMIYDEITRIYRANEFTWPEAQRHADEITKGHKKAF